MATHLFTPGTVPSAYRVGKVVYVPRGAALPANCVKCGAPAQRPWEKKFSWHARWVYFLLLGGVLLYAILIVLLRKSMTLNVPLCETHHGTRERSLNMGLILSVAALPAGIAIGNLPGNLARGIAVVVCLLMFVAGGVIASGNNYLRPRLIDDYHGEFAGPCDAFLQLLPER